MKKWARIGEKARIGHHSVLGGDPQHLDFDSSTESFLTLGNQVRIGVDAPRDVSVHREELAQKDDETPASRADDKVAR